MKPLSRHKQRICVMRSIYQYLLTKKDIDEILKENINLEDKNSIGFIVENTVGVIDNIDYLIQQISPKLNKYDFDRLGYVERAILLFSAYELNQGETDRAIVINEAVEIAKQYCDDDAPAFINGVLDQL